MKIKKIFFLGGEPLLSNKLFESLMLAKYYSIITSITTNVILLNDVISQLIIICNVDEIIISIDGMSSETNDYIRGEGNFNKVVDGIRNLVYLRNMNKSKLNIMCSVCLNSINFKESSLILSTMSDLGVDGILISKIENTGQASKNWGNLELNLKDYITALENIAR